ncbi:Gluconate 5-dehydrogenase [Ceratocystis platani]|uniref:Gluconate 5-dehydrogenase n=1 Tax=Ceratocystis fimbriata f. sp. platani TaxID=88771 RepID=A0A0F8DE92_CERFI|nr:Gluconate 5-dehydrogenase [Ceratocystis platani]
MSEDPTTGYYFTNVLRHDTYSFIDSFTRDLSGRYVFVTGASRGIGRELLFSFARAGAAGIAFGARSFRNGSDEITVLTEQIHAAASEGWEARQASGGDAGSAAEQPQPPLVLPLVMDVTDAASVEAAAQAVEASFPRLDVLVNNAGVLEKRATLADADVQTWLNTLDVNLKGTFLATHYFLPLLVRSKGRRWDSKMPNVGGRDAGEGDERHSTGAGLQTVVNINSLASQMVSPGASAYQVSKLAQLRLTEFVNCDHAKDGLLGWAIHPGGVATQLGLSLPVERHVALTESPRLCADAVVFLVEKRREWLAGRYLMAQWDMEELLAREQEIVEGDKLKVRIRL